MILIQNNVPNCMRSCCFVPKTPFFTCNNFPILIKLPQDCGKLYYLVNTMSTQLIIKFCNFQLTNLRNEYFFLKTRKVAFKYLMLNQPRSGPTLVSIPSICQGSLTDCFIFKNKIPVFSCSDFVSKLFCSVLLWKNQVLFRYPNNSFT